MGIETSNVIEHLLMSVVPWFLGGLLGVGVGLLCAFLLHLFFGACPRVRFLLPLFPWRAFVMGLLTVLWVSFPLYLWGKGIVSGGMVVGASVFLLGFSGTCSLMIEHWHPTPLASRYLGSVRTLLAASFVLAAGVGFFRGGGIGEALYGAVRMGDHEVAWSGIFMIFGLLLIFDLAFGIPQMMTGYFLGREKDGKVDVK